MARLSVALGLPVNSESCVDELGSTLEETCGRTVGSFKTPCQKLCLRVSSISHNQGRIQQKPGISGVDAAVGGGVGTYRRLLVILRTVKPT